MYNKCKDSKIKIKLLAILLFIEGNPSLGVAKILHKSDSTVREWAHRYNENGVNGLIPLPGGKRHSKLTEEQSRKISEVLLSSPREYGFNKSNWTLSSLKLWIQKEYGVVFSLQGLHYIIRKLGFTHQRPKKQGKYADKQLQKEFRDHLEEVIDNADKDTVILYHDEAIITTEPTICAKWALKGQQPVIPTDKGSRKRKVIYEAVDPEAGKVHYKSYESGNKKNFQSFLKESDEKVSK